jgi:hypothetical protein
MTALNAAIISRLGTITALTNLLAAGSASIFNMQAPEGSNYPYVVFSLQAGGDLNDNPHRTKSLVLFVRAYSTTSAKNAGSIDAQIDTALHLVPFANVTGWTNTWLARETDLETVENPPTGSQVFMQGGLYRSRTTK